MFLSSGLIHVFVHLSISSTNSKPPGPTAPYFVPPYPHPETTTSSSASIVLPPTPSFIGTVPSSPPHRMAAALASSRCCRRPSLLTTDRRRSSVARCALSGGVRILQLITVVLVVVAGR